MGMVKVRYCDIIESNYKNAWSEFCVMYAHEDPSLKNPMAKIMELTMKGEDENEVEILRVDAKKWGLISDSNENKGSKEKLAIKEKIESIRAKIKEAYYADDITKCYDILKEAELLNTMHNEMLKEEPYEIPQEEQWYKNGGSFREYNGLDLIKTEENIKKTIFAKTKEFIENNYQEEALREKIQKEIFNIDINEEQNWETMYAVVLNALMDGSLDFDSKKRFAARMQNAKINDIKSQYVFYIDSLKEEEFNTWVTLMYFSKTQEQKDRLFNELNNYDGRKQIKKLMQDTEGMKNKISLIETQKVVIEEEMNKLKNGQENLKKELEKTGIKLKSAMIGESLYKRDYEILTQEAEKRNLLQDGPFWALCPNWAEKLEPTLGLVFDKKDDKNDYVKSYRYYRLEDIYKFIIGKGIKDYAAISPEEHTYKIEGENIDKLKKYKYKIFEESQRDLYKIGMENSEKIIYAGDTVAADLYPENEYINADGQILIDQQNGLEPYMKDMPEEILEEILIYISEPQKFIKKVNDYKKSEEEKKAQLAEIAAKEMLQAQAKRKEELKGYTIKQAMPRINEVVIKHYNGEVLLCDNRVFSYFELYEEGEDPFLNAKCITRLGSVKDLSKKSKKELYLQSADTQKNKEDWLHHIEKLSSSYDIPFYYDQELANEDMYKYLDVSKRIQIKEKMKNELKDELKKHAKIKESIKAKWIKYETYCKDNEIKDKSALKKDLTKEENEVNILEILRDDAERLAISVRDWESIIGPEEKIEDLLYSKENPNGLKYYITQMGNLKYFYLENSELSYIDVIEVEEN